ncbi:MAG: hypothetical protein R3324_17565, partial [Halobacteriales archaeon]|nr:hypothetical protein [Halobacteriales archaeon]
MSLPEAVRERLGEEEPSATVPLGSDDMLVVTPTRSLIYRGEGLLSNESVEEFPHDAERIAVTEGRRKSTVHLDYGIEGELEFTIPSKRVDEALAPVLRGVLIAGEVIDPDESINQLYRLGELTVAITDARVIKHVGDAVWDEEFEEFGFDRVTGID